MKKSAPRGVQIRKHKLSTSIRISFTYKGAECRETLSIPATKDNLKWAENRRNEILVQIARGTFDYHKEFPGSKMAERLCGPLSASKRVTVREKLERYFAESAKNLKASSLASYRGASKARIYPHLGNLAVQDVTPATLRKWISKLGQTIKIKSIKNTLHPLNRILEEAVTDGIIESNPLQKVKVSNLVDRRTGASNIGADPLSYEEIFALLFAEQRPQERNFWQFAIFTGLQTGEQIALRWDDVDWVKNRIRVDTAIVDGVEDTPKTTARYRHVNLTAPARWALEQQRQYTQLAGDHVFHDPRLNKPWKNDVTLRGRWKTLCRRAGVRYRKPYTTRQTFCSQMLSQGKNPLYVAKQMGHANMNMIIKHYGAWVENGVDAPARPFDEWTEFCSENRPLIAHGSR